VLSDELKIVPKKEYENEETTPVNLYGFDADVNEITQTIYLPKGDNMSVSYQEKVKYIKEKTGLSYEIMGQRLKVSWHQVSQWYHGKASPQQSNAATIDEWHDELKNDSQD
jgi:ribosome-binding protein aMBF1 (putative translation factor)